MHSTVFSGCLLCARHGGFHRALKDSSSIAGLKMEGATERIICSSGGSWQGDKKRGILCHVMSSVQSNIKPWVKGGWSEGPARQDVERNPHL